MSILNNSLLLGAPAAGSSTYQITRSLRFSSGDSSFLSRTPSVAGNRKTWTWAGWVKRAALGVRQNIFGTGDASFYNGFWVEFFSNDKIRIGDIGASTLDLELITTQVFRDCSAWGHLLVAVDTTQATASNRVSAYWNGSKITAFDTASYPMQNFDSRLNTTAEHSIGRAGSYNGQYFSGYIADPFLIDGQALDPSSFTTSDLTTGQLIPKAYTGTYGTNGFHLPFSDNSATTATTLGKDTSPNGNNWTPTNFSVTAGAGNDSLVDTPVSSGTDTGVGGQVTGNYCTWNPLKQSSFNTYSNGNLDATFNSTTYSAFAFGTFGISSGQWYWEITVNSTNYIYPAVGITTDLNRTTERTSGSSGDYYYFPSGNKDNGGTGGGVAYASSFSAGDIIGVALNMNAGTITFYKNGVSQGQAFSGISGTALPSILGALSVAISANFGQRPFAYPVSGFKALCDTNLPEGTITTSGTFTGNANADGPFIWLNGVPTAMTINSNAVTFGTHADKLANGFKLRTNSTSYNTSGSNSYSITTTGAKFKYARAQANP